MFPYTTLFRSSPAAITTNVTYGSFFFVPRVVSINAGDTVVWTNGFGSHTVLGTGSDPICGGAQHSMGAKAIGPNDRVARIDRKSTRLNSSHITICFPTRHSSDLAPLQLPRTSPTVHFFLFPG